METKDIIAALAALAQESRLAVFRLLVQAGPDGMAASKIAESIAVTPSALSFHMKELFHAGLVQSRQDGRFVIYSANFGTMTDVITFLSSNCCGGRSCVPDTSC
ncbi:DNA-binding transcriptional ArsR family regulator [Herbaspirillum sp. Sphag1AN]|uniref:ArsR/SmtB family transcription factor n=1 Tax=unclassified Herbaspirillum TaxID=2624150 RepID=UPI001622ADF8|nr:MULTISPECIES: metalloregulator ArsR/SmtB family transcription factor [unclassified Herbaspirillum]MBB3212234.1 DNA-binding transcriptional ArsR family regulator [Herbaspirillum sp. Sphag1AN]MBB3245668.1 DNA-binding transcriptional ArsR family regulator [Herbaspirillum sp. Sphag64]